MGFPAHQDSARANLSPAARARTYAPPAVPMVEPFASHCNADPGRGKDGWCLLSIARLQAVLPLRQARPLAGDHFHAGSGGRGISPITNPEDTSHAAAL